MKKKYLSARDGFSWRLSVFAVLLAFSSIHAEEEQLLFLPTHPVFDRLIGDPREPQFALLTNLTYPKFEGSIGPTLEFLQWRPKDGTRWGWGIWGGSFIELDSVGHFAYPERVSDWYLGIYFSETAGAFSHRLDYTHVSSHLGDELFLYTYHFIYTRESFRWMTSFKPSDQVRLYAGAGYSPHIAPWEKAFFFHAGAELYSGYFPFLLGTTGRGYFTYDLKVKDEAGSVTNQDFQLGFQWKGKEEDAGGVRLALTCYNGNSEYGQFYQIPDNHWGLAAFFDP
jgi:hypothetical protein